MKYIIPIFFLTLLSCKKETLPKPSGYLRLIHKKVNYQNIKTDCPFKFEIPINAKILVNKKCWLKIKYPNLKATIDITYRPIKNNLRELLLESEKLTIKHAIKAAKISHSPLFENYDDLVFGRVSDVIGNAASPLQFYITDSIKHFITGAVYFNVQPNYDSIYPSIKYLEKDIKHLIETTTWKN
ncbi:MAG: gliding motility lipoprotein GldD [Flavobacteriaceae bacterium]|nr:gliding motility lipoprotein GldD [Flavobacteriaceae bacterium]